MSELRRGTLFPHTPPQRWHGRALRPLSALEGLYSPRKALEGLVSKALKGFLRAGEPPEVPQQALESLIKHSRTFKAPKGRIRTAKAL